MTAKKTRTEAAADAKRRAGRPFGAVGRRKSKLRETVKRLHEMNADAVQIVQDSLDGKDVDPAKLATAKWVITTTVAVNKAAVEDEKELNSDFIDRATAAKKALIETQEEKEELEAEEGTPKRAKVSFSVVK